MIGVKKLIYLASHAALALSTFAAGTAFAFDWPGLGGSPDWQHGETGKKWNDGRGPGGHHARGCGGLPGHGALQSALEAAVAVENSGLDNPMWATLVDRNGTICAVAYSGPERSAVWPGSRAISAQKAYTGNAFSTNELSLSTANLYSAVQPGGSLFGLSDSNPVDPTLAYEGPPEAWGSARDPLVGKRMGGINVFGGGLALYAEGQMIVGGVGASGDTSCADHNIAWRIRNWLGLDYLGTTVGGVAALFAADQAHPDNIIFDIAQNESASGFGHPECLNTSGSDSLPPVSE